MSARPTSRLFPVLCDFGRRIMALSHNAAPLNGVNNVQNVDFESEKNLSLWAT